VPSKGSHTLAGASPAMAKGQSHVAWIMGVNFHNVGYLHCCAEQGVGEADLNKIEVFGERLSDCIRPFKLHRSVNEQYSWKSET
jgi:hypothetical protein